MTPSEPYYKAKRSLIFFVGALLLAVVVGFKFSDGKQHLSILPFELERPDWIAAIFFVVVLFNAFQFSLQWAAQTAEVQANRFHRIDFISTTAIAAVAMFISAGKFFWAYVPTWSESTWWFVVGISAMLALAGIVSVASAKLLELVSIFVGRQVKARAQEKDYELSELLKSKTWILVFDPARKGARKEITFEPDGFVGKGRNENEYRWQVRNGLLEIFDRNANTFSRFSYSERGGEFVHTNDDDTKSIRSQRIYPAPTKSRAG
jgi:hypothetical protein